MKKELRAELTAIGAVTVITIITVLLIVLCTPFSIVLNGDPVVEIEAQSEYEDEGARASRSVFNYSKKLVRSDNIDLSRPGVYQVAYTMNKKGKEYSAVRTVVVKDTTAPALTLNGDETVSVDYLDEFADPGISSFDTVDGSLSAAVRTEVVEIESYNPDNSASKSYLYTYTSTDSSGNQAQLTRRVNVSNPIREREFNDGKSYVFLTFDDGPSDNVTNRILDILAQYGVKATFFVIDYDEDHVDRIKRIVNEGHSIAVHTKSHEYGEIYYSADAYLDGVHYMQQKIYKDAGVMPNIIRFPGGSSNTVSAAYKEGVMTELVERVAEEGLYYFDWNVDSTDASGNNVPAEQLIASVENNLMPGESNIVLMHDTDAKETTAEALPTIIQYALDNGYEFAPINKNTPGAHHGLNN